jgi:predicted ATPase
MQVATRGFLNASATREQPLVLVLDVLHWVVPDSLDLVAQLLRRPETVPLLVVGAYRRSVVGDGHPLTPVLTELAERGLATEITLDALAPDALSQLLADTLHRPAADVAPLTREVAAKTGANPLFVGQFLHRLYEQDVLRFDPRLPGFGWDMDEVRQVPVTDNVVDLVAGRVGRLGPDDRRLLETAALVGDRFDLSTLALASGWSTGAVAACLRAAVREYLVVPVDSGLGDAASDPFGDDWAAAADGRPDRRAFRWIHDRIRQGTLSHIPAADVAGRRVAIGLALLAALPEAERAERLFEITDHLNAGADLLDDEAQRVRLADLNRQAAERARRAGAQDAAQRHVAAGLLLLPAGAWSHHYELAFSLHVEAALAANLGGDRDRVHDMLTTAAAHARDDLHRLEVVRLRVGFLIDTGEMADAIRFVPQGLALLELGDRDGPAAAAAMRARLAGLRLEDIVGAPAMTDPKALVATEFLAGLLQSVHADADLLPLLTAHGVDLTLRHGPGGASAPLFGYFAGVMANLFGDDDVAAWCVRVTLRLRERFPNAASAPDVAVLGFVLPMWYHSPDELLALVRWTSQAAAERGNLKFSAYNRWVHAACMFIIGTPLDRVADEVAAVWGLINQYQVEVANLANRILDDAVCALRGVLSDLAPVPSPVEVGLIEPSAQGRLGYLSGTYLLHKLMLDYLFGSYPRALRLARTAAEVPSLTGTMYQPELAFFHALTVTACYGDASPEQQRVWDRTLDGFQSTLDRCAARGPVLFSHKALLVSAERARLAGDLAQAMGRYDQAMGAAREYGIVHIEAMAAELAARHAPRCGSAAEAADYLDRAVACYERWGATAKARQLIGADPS